MPEKRKGKSGQWEKMGENRENLYDMSKKYKNPQKYWLKYIRKMKTMI